MVVYLDVAGYWSPNLGAGTHARFVFGHSRTSRLRTSTPDGSNPSQTSHSRISLPQTFPCHTVPPMAGIQDAPLVPADDRATWRAWLEANHATVSGAWLVTWRKGHGPVLDYGEAVEEALCFGWVDATGGRLDERRTKLYFAPRKQRSVWSASNKGRVERLIAAGLMRPAGLAAIERAKSNGAWTALDEVEQGIVPPDLAAA